MATANSLASYDPTDWTTRESMHEAEQGSITLRIGEVSWVCVTTVVAKERPNSTSQQTESQSFKAHLEAIDNGAHTEEQP
jgi:hypothetical protein